MGWMVRICDKPSSEWMRFCALVLLAVDTGMAVFGPFIQRLFSLIFRLMAEKVLSTSKMVKKLG